MAQHSSKGVNLPPPPPGFEDVFVGTDNTVSPATLDDVEMDIDELEQELSHTAAEIDTDIKPETSPETFVSSRTRSAASNPINQTSVPHTHLVSSQRLLSNSQPTTIDVQSADASMAKKSYSAAAAAPPPPKVTEPVISIDGKVDDQPHSHPQPDAAAAASSGSTSTIEQTGKLSRGPRISTKPRSFAGPSTKPFEYQVKFLQDMFTECASQNRRAMSTEETRAACITERSILGLSPISSLFVSYKSGDTVGSRKMVCDSPVKKWANEIGKSYCLPPLYKNKQGPSTNQSFRPPTASEKYEHNTSRRAESAEDKNRTRPTLRPRKTELNQPDSEVQASQSSEPASFSENDFPELNAQPDVPNKPQITIRSKKAKSQENVQNENVSIFDHIPSD